MDNVVFWMRSGSGVFRVAEDFGLGRISGWDGFWDVGLGVLWIVGDREDV